MVATLRVARRDASIPILAGMALRLGARLVFRQTGPRRWRMTVGYERLSTELWFAEGPPTPSWVTSPCTCGGLGLVVTSTMTPCPVHGAPPGTWHFWQF